MRIFLGSSSEAAIHMKKVAGWLPRGVAVRWDEIGSFEPGRYTFDSLLQHARTVDGAIFVFAEDDVSKIRGDEWLTTRDNVWLEFGLFVGSLTLNRVRPVVIGNPRWATDLLGITRTQLPKAFKAGANETKRARAEIRKWYQGLSPVFLRRQACDVFGDRVRSERHPVEHILTTKATNFLRENASSEIRALCSDKGLLGEDYYRRQFDWVKQGKPRRKLRRVFVGRKAKLPFGVEFTPSELEGIRMHLGERGRGSRVEVKWVYEDNPVLGAEYRDSLVSLYLVKSVAKSKLGAIRQPGDSRHRHRVDGRRSM